MPPWLSASDHCELPILKTRPAHERIHKWLYSLLHMAMIGNHYKSAACQLPCQYYSVQATLQDIKIYGKQPGRSFSIFFSETVEVKKCTSSWHIWKKWLYFVKTNGFNAVNGLWRQLSVYFCKCKMYMCRLKDMCLPMELRTCLWKLEALWVFGLAFPLWGSLMFVCSSLSSLEHVTMFLIVQQFDDFCLSTRICLKKPEALGSLAWSFHIGTLTLCFIHCTMFFIILEFKDLCSFGTSFWKF